MQRIVLNAPRNWSWDARSKFSLAFPCRAMGREPQQVWLRPAPVAPAGPATGGAGRSPQRRMATARPQASAENPIRASEVQFSGTLSVRAFLKGFLKGFFKRTLSALCEGPLKGPSKMGM